MADLPEIAGSSSMRERYTRAPPGERTTEDEETHRIRPSRNRPSQSDVSEVVEVEGGPRVRLPRNPLDVSEVVEVEDMPRVRLPGSRRPPREGVALEPRTRIRPNIRPNTRATPAARRFRGFDKLFPAGEPGSDQLRRKIYGRTYDAKPVGYVEGDWLIELTDGHLDPVGSYILITDYFQDYIDLLREEGVAVGDDGEVITEQEEPTEPYEDE